jgi:RNA polymerase sigma factor (sigma-70 family)
MVMGKIEATMGTAGRTGLQRDADIEARNGRRDDAGAWGELVRRFAPYVHAIAVRAYGLPEREAHEVFEEVFLRTFLQLDELRDDEVKRAWIVRLTRRVAADQHRMARGHDLEPPEDLLQELEDALRVREAMRRLPAVQREVVQRFYVEGQGKAMTAEALGMSVEDVASNVRSARRRLRGQLGSVTRRR